MIQKQVTFNLKQIVSFIVMLVLLTYSFTAGGIKNYIFQSVAVVIAAFGVILVGMFFVSSGRFAKRSLPIIVLAFLCIAVILINRNGNFSRGVYENDFVIIASFIFLVLAMNVKEWHMPFIFISVAWVLLHSTVTILEYAIPGFYTSSILPLFKSAMYYNDLIWVFSIGKIPGLAGHFSTNGIYLSVGLVILSVCLMNRRNKRKLPLIILVVITAIALLLTGKRAVLIFGAVGIFIAYFCLNADKPSKRIVKIIGVVILIVLLFFIARTFIPALDNFINRFIETSERGDITTGRGELNSVAVRFFAENPIIGIGWDHYKYYYLAVYNKLLNAHNVFLQLFAENGILGAAPFFGLFVLLYVRAIRALLRYVKTEAEKDPACTLALTLSISMQTMFLLYCLTGNPLYDSQMLIPYLCSCAMGEYYILRINRKREG